MKVGSGISNGDANFDNKLDMAVRFLEDLEGTSIHPEQQDKWIWKEDVSGL